MHRSGNLNLQVILFLGEGGGLYGAVTAAKLERPPDAGREGCGVVISNRSPLLGCCQVTKQH